MLTMRGLVLRQLHISKVHQEHQSYHLPLVRVPSILSSFDCLRLYVTQVYTTQAPLKHLRIFPSSQEMALQVPACFTIDNHTPRTTRACSPRLRA